MSRVGGRHDDVRCHDEQRARPALASKCVEELIRRSSRPGKLVLRHTPYRRDVVTCCGIVDSAVSRKLVGLLAVLAASLSVTLPRQRSKTARRSSWCAQRERDVDVRERVVDTLGLLLGPARRQHHAGSRFAQQVSRTDQLRFGHSGQPLDPFWPVRGEHAANGVEAFGSIANVIGIRKPVAHQNVEQAVRQRSVGAGLEGQVKRRPRRCGRLPGIDHDEAAAVFLLLLEVLHDGRHRFGGVAAGQQHRFGSRDVGQRERQTTVDAERLLRSGCGRRHAEASVVVDIRSPQRDAGKLAEQIALFVGERAPAKHRDGIAAEIVLNLAKAPRDQIDRIGPRGGFQAA